MTEGENKSRAAKLRDTHQGSQMPSGKFCPTQFMKNGCSQSMFKLTMGPRADRGVSPIYNSTRIGNLNGRGKQCWPETGGR